MVRLIEIACWIQVTRRRSKYLLEEIDKFPCRWLKLHIFMPGLNPIRMFINRSLFFYDCMAINSPDHVKAALKLPHNFLSNIQTSNDRIEQ